MPWVFGVGMRLPSNQASPSGDARDVRAFVCAEMPALHQDVDRPKGGAGAVP